MQEMCIRDSMIAIEATTKNKVGFDTYAQYQFLYPINQLKVTTWASDGELTALFLSRKMQK